MFSQTVEYALRAMACLALEPESRTASAALAERTQVPPDYLAKVLQQLSAANLIEGRRGVGGGYRLSSEPKDINLLDVINAVEPLKRITTCPLKLPNHGPKLCPLHHRMDEAIAGVIRVFRDNSLQDLLVADQDFGGSVPLCNTEQTVKLSLSSKPKT